jgi:hypothetical protein
VPPATAAAAAAVSPRDRGNAARVVFEVLVENRNSDVAVWAGVAAAERHRQEREEEFINTRDFPNMAKHRKTQPDIGVAISWTRG